MVRLGKVKEGFLRRGDGIDRAGCVAADECGCR